MDSNMKRAISTLISLTFFFQTMSPAVHAQMANQQVPDIEPPAITFELGDEQIPDGLKTLSVTVTDNRGVAAVTLFYRDGGDIAYTEKAMLESSPNVYSADVTLDAVISDRLEFYIRAEDVSGNSVFEGQKFAPLAYTVVADMPVAQGTRSASTPSAEDEEEEGMSTLTMILIGLGVLALAGGGGGGGGGSTAPTTGSITITTDIPQ